MILAHAARHGSLLAGSIGASLQAAAAEGLLTEADQRKLTEARILFTELLQRERLHSTEAAPINWNDASIERDLARDLGFASGPALLRAVDTQGGEVAAIFKRLVRAD
jgi:glutamate-ammonia-ligase adenylyltransferase